MTAATIAGMAGPARLRGVHVAIVAAGADAPGGAGDRVQLRLPWLGDDGATRSARVAVAMAGDRRGSRALPAVGDQVLVVFERGDVDRPIVIGAVWSAEQPACPDGGDGDGGGGGDGGDGAAPSDVKTIKSRSGHRVIFDDRRGREQVTIVDASRRNAIVLDARSRSVRVVAAGDVAIRASRDVVVAGHELAIAATTAVSVHAGGRVVVAAARTLGVIAASRVTASGATLTAGSPGGVDSKGGCP